MRAVQACLGVAIALLFGCASGGNEAETLRGPDADAEIVEAVVLPVPESDDRLDWNGDRHVDREEFRNFFARAFHFVDTDDDRLIRGDEAANLPAEAVRQADLDGDGALDVDEYVALVLVLFERCDRNADDVLGEDEERACRAETAGR